MKSHNKNLARNSQEATSQARGLSGKAKAQSAKGGAGKSHGPMGRGESGQKADKKPRG